MSSTTNSSPPEKGSIPSRRSLRRHVNLTTEKRKEVAQASLESPIIRQCHQANESRKFSAKNTWKISRARKAFLADEFSRDEITHPMISKKVLITKSRVKSDQEAIFLELAVKFVT